MNGSGIYTFPDGATFDGQWKDDLKHGNGVYTYADGFKQEGTYKDGKLNGEITEVDIDGDRTTKKWTYENGKRIK